MSLGRKPSKVGSLIITPLTRKLELSKQITDLATGGHACPESKIRIARRHTEEQLKDLLYLLQSFHEGKVLNG